MSLGVFAILVVLFYWSIAALFITLWAQFGAWLFRYHTGAARSALWSAGLILSWAILVAPFITPPIAPRFEFGFFNPSGAPIAALSLIALVWCAGFLYHWFRFINLNHYYKRLLARSQPLGDQQIANEIERVRQTMFAEGPVSIRVSSEVNSPILIGFWNPVLIIPRYFSGRKLCSDRELGSHRKIMER